jgi:ribosome-associated protein
MIPIQDLLTRVVEVLQDKKAEDIKVLSIESLFADYFVIVSALTSRHLWAMTQAIQDLCKPLGIRPLVQGRRDEPRWVIVDVGGIFIHLFAPEARQEYQLEALWSGKEAQAAGSENMPSSMEGAMEGAMKGTIAEPHTGQGQAGQQDFGSVQSSSQVSSPMASQVTSHASSQASSPMTSSAAAPSLGQKTLA